jgi:adenylosuccinate lyase
MIPRYSHPTVTEQFSATQTYSDWLHVELATLIAQTNQGVLPECKFSDVLAEQVASLQIDESAVADIAGRERWTGHDVAAFLQWLRAQVDQGQWLHFGLTSSDLVDTAQGMRFRRLHRPMLVQLGDLTSTLAQWTNADLPMLGVTHGQAAEPTSLRARAWHWLSYIESPVVHLSTLTRRMQVCKLSGPVGTYAHNPSSVEGEVAAHLELIPQGPGASQIVPRSNLAMWASTVATLLSAYSKIATDLRLLATMDEAYWVRSKEHVASSAFAHKNNPIEAEQMVGFAQMARGFAAMLQPLDLWLERDISHSSVERVAVPDLWHLLFTATERMTKMLAPENLVFRPLITEQHLYDRANEAWTHKKTLAAIRDGMGYDQARDFALDFDTESYDIQEDARRFMDNYPASVQK